MLQLFMDLQTNLRKTLLAVMIDIDLENLLNGKLKKKGYELEISTSGFEFIGILHNPEYKHTCSYL